jgi:hypothetical protein
MDDIKAYVKDEFMMEQSRILTTIMLNCNINLNKICEAVKMYQRLYIVIHKQDPIQAKSFTAKTWNRLNQEKQK